MKKNKQFRLLLQTISIWHMHLHVISGRTIHCSHEIHQSQTSIFKQRLHSSPKLCLDKEEQYKQSDTVTLTWRSLWWCSRTPNRFRMRWQSLWSCWLGLLFQVVCTPLFGLWLSVLWTGWGSVLRRGMLRWLLDLLHLLLAVLKLLLLKEEKKVKHFHHFQSQYQNFYSLS